MKPVKIKQHTKTQQKNKNKTATIRWTTRLNVILRETSKSWSNFVTYWNNLKVSRSFKSASWAFPTLLHYYSANLSFNHFQQT